ncbi:hypothetical protein BC835DRAFT_1290954, partial [Cytidiella melzeri]
RRLNQLCNPNCTAKIISINGEKKTVFYAKQNTERGSEITYGKWCRSLARLAWADRTAC